MEKNVGGMDRTARLIVGPLLVIVGIAGYAGFVSLAFLGIGAALAAVVVFLIGAILTVTGYTRKCPVNRLLGIDTYRRGAGEKEAETPVERTA